MDYSKKFIFAFTYFREYLESKKMDTLDRRSTNECLRNPSPPPFTEEEKEVISADYIGDSLFSKKWILLMLLKLYKHEADIYSSSDLQPDNSEESDIWKLNSVFEEEVCELWDATANTEVALFLHYNEGKQIILEVLGKTESPRLLEICFGILGNLVCVEKICISVSEDEIFRVVMLDYLNVTDALSLVELTRMICVCFSKKETLPLWMTSVTDSVLDKLIDILGNSLKVDLLDHVIIIIDVIFDSDSEFVDKHSGSVLYSAIYDSYALLEQEKKEESLLNLLHVLQLTSTTNNGVKQLSSNDKMLKFLCACILDEKTVFPNNRASCLASLFSVFGCILSVNEEESMTLLNDNIDAINILISVLLERLNKLLSRTLHSSNTTDTYISIYLELLQDICQTLPKFIDNDIANILTCLRSNERKLNEIFQKCLEGCTSLQWKSIIKNLRNLDEEYKFLNFKQE